MKKIPKKKFKNKKNVGKSMTYEAEGTKAEQDLLIRPVEEVHVYRASRWCIRDGTGFGKPPYYGDLKTGYLRAADLGGIRHQGARQNTGGALAKPEDGH